MNDLVLRPTGVMAYERCGYSYKLETLLRIRPVETSHALAFGTAGHKATLPFVKAHAMGGDVDPVPLFQAAWQEQLDTKIVQFTLRGAKELMEIGTKLAQEFPKVWLASNLVAVTSKIGVLVENRLKLRIEPGLTLSCEPDIVAHKIGTGTDDLIIPDAKFASSAAFDGFAKVSDQLSAYQLAVEINKEGVLGLDASASVKEVGFFEGIKNKKPVWKSQMTRAHTRQQLGEYVSKVKMVGALVRKGYFPKHTGGAFESPCAMCSLQRLCHNNDATGYASPLGDVLELVHGTPEPQSIAA